jgi:hypothetical protein
MTNQNPVIIARYEVLFAVRTGITILMPRIPVLDGGIEQHASFRISGENPRDLVIDGAGGTAILKNFQKDYLDEAIERGFIMFYETKDDEVVRCTHCSFRKA